MIGKPLNEWKSKFSNEEMVNIARQLASALVFLHGQKITHRMLSNGNILLDSAGRVKLFNYGMFFMTGGGNEVSFPLG